MRCLCVHHRFPRRADLGQHLPARTREWDDPGVGVQSILDVTQGLDSGLDAIQSLACLFWGQRSAVHG